MLMPGPELPRPGSGSKQGPPPSGEAGEHGAAGTQLPPQASGVSEDSTVDSKASFLRPSSNGTVPGYSGDAGHEDTSVCWRPAVRDVDGSTVGRGEGALGVRGAGPLGNRAGAATPRHLDVEGDTGLHSATIVQLPAAGMYPPGRESEADHQLAGAPPAVAQDQGLLEQALAFEGASAVSLVAQRYKGEEGVSAAMEIVLEDGVTMTVELDSGEKRLRELGYTQTLQRDLTAFQLYAASFSCIGLFVGIVPYYGSAFVNGGPVAVIWYWWIPGVFATLMTLSLSEIASSLPTAASMYFWAGFLAPARMSNFATWFTGWLEFLGSSIGSAGTALAGIQVLNAMVLAVNSTRIPATADSPETWVAGFTLNAGQQVGCATAVLVVVGCINCCRIGVVGKLLAASCIFQILVGVTIIVCVPWVAPTRQPASFVFGTLLDNWTAPSAAYAFVLALLLPQYSMYSMDCAAHTSEEAKNADVVTPTVMVASIVSVVVLGWGVLVAITFSIQSVDALSDPAAVTQGTQYFVQIIWDVFYSRYGSGIGALVFIVLIYISLFSASVAQVMTATRIAYALSRDGGIPFSFIFTYVSAQKVPLMALLLTCSISAIALLPVLFNLTAYYAVTSMATIGWFGSYAFPMVLRFIMPEKKFLPGPFYMGKYIGVTGGKVVHGLGSLYALYTIFTFMLPYAFPVQFNNFNYAPVVLAVVLLILIGWWIIDVRKWFRGPHAKEPEAEKHDIPEPSATVEWF